MCVKPDGSTVAVRRARSLVAARELYSGEEFTELAEWCKGLMDDVAADLTAGDRERYRNRVLTSSRYEYMFWDAAWRRAEWPG